MVIVGKKECPQWIGKEKIAYPLTYTANRENIVIDEVKFIEITDKLKDIDWEK